MSTRLGIFIDISNLYYCVGKKYRNKVDYQKYMEFLKDFGSPSVAIGYGAQIKNEACKFIDALHKAGIAHKYKRPKSYPSGVRKANWDVGMAVDAISRIDDYDMLVLGSADGDMEPLLEYCTHRGKRVLVFATNIAQELHKYPHIEIPESLLEPTDEG